MRQTTADGGLQHAEHQVIDKSTNGSGEELRVRFYMPSAAPDRPQIPADD